MLLKVLNSRSRAVTRFSYCLGSTRFGILAAQKLGRGDKKLGGGDGEKKEGKICVMTTRYENRIF